MNVTGWAGHCACLPRACVLRHLGSGGMACVPISRGIRLWLPPGVDRGAEPAPVPLAAEGVRSPLRLLASRRADERADESLAPHADESGAQQGTRE